MDTNKPIPIIKKEPTADCVVAINQEETPEFHEQDLTTPLKENFDLIKPSAKPPKARKMTVENKQ